MQFNTIIPLCAILFSLGLSSCGSPSSEENNETNTTALDSAREYGATLNLAEPLATKPQNKYAKVIGWSEGQSPIAPSGYSVMKFAKDLNSPRNIYVADNGDIFVAEARTERSGEETEKAASRNTVKDKSPNRILLFRDTNHDGIADEQTVFIDNLKQPFGMLIAKGSFYVANTDGLWRFPYKAGDKKITSKGEKILSLPAGGYNNHWTRNLRINQDSTKIFVSVGSGTNVAEQGMDNEIRRANILEVNLDGSSENIYASGLRNPVGMDLEPTSGQLWTAVNERDELGDEIVPDYITGVKKGGFYGWPFAYWGNHPDPRLAGQRDDLVQQSIVPDFALGSHTASLGLAFSNNNQFEKGAYIGQHGSWNRSEFVGYKVLFVPFEGGKPTGEHQDFLTGFVANDERGEVYGRPVGVVFSKSGYMLVADDAANTIWAVLPISKP